MSDDSADIEDRLGEDDLENTENSPNKNSPSMSQKEIEEKKDYSQKEFEEFVSKSGAAGSFMIFRSEEKDTELGIDQL